MDTGWNPPDTQKARALWENARDHRALVVCGFPATCEDPAAEAALAFPIGDPTYVEASLEARNRFTEELTRRIVNLATLASASASAVQSCCCLLRSCISQKVGHLLRIIPPAQAEPMAKYLDQCIANATWSLVGAEDIPPFQRELLTIPANRGGWGLPRTGANQGMRLYRRCGRDPQTTTLGNPRQIYEELRRAQNKGS